MEELERIRGFLRTVRRRALLAEGLRAGTMTGAALVGAILALAVCAVRVGPAAFWPTVTTSVLLGVTGVGLALGWIAPARRLRTERAMAMFVGRRHPAVASDLLSAVELAVPAGQPIPHGGSPSIARAFHGAVADTLGPLDARRLVPLTDAWKGVLVLTAALGVLGTALAWAPAARRGLRLLLRHPTRFEGASVSRDPLVGDVRLTYVFPAYTGLPKKVIEGSTGDVVAIKGTEVIIETRPLRSTRQAVLLLGDAGEGGELPVTLTNGKLVAQLGMRESGSYRFWLAPLIGRPVREARAHRIVVEADRPPDVDIIGPADRLELQSPRPVEIGYSARDDFGLGTIDLVYRIDDGAERRVPLADASGARTAHDKTVFEPDASALGPGARVAYRIEARDRDDVSGAKTGTSRTLYLVIQNPRENLDEQLAREKELLDKLVGTLADRLEIQEPPSTPVVLNAAGQLAGWMAVHEGEESHLALLGRLVDEEKRGGTTTKALVTALAGIADRLGRQMRDETALLGALRTKADENALTSSAFTKLHAANGKHVQEMESAVLLLDDLIGRQRLEDLAALGRELTSAYKRLQDLLSRYNATKDEALRRQLEREIRDLRGRIEELARKIGELKQRNDVPAEWQNLPDMKDALAKAQKLDQLLQKGDAQSLQQALSELGTTLESLQRMLDKNAEDFGGERFPQENRLASDLMKKVGDLEGDQRSLAGDGQELAGEVDAEMQKRMQGQLDQLLQRMKDNAEALQKKLSGRPPRELGEMAQDELGRAQEAAKQLKRLLPAKDFGEARRETDRALSSLKRVRRSVDERNSSRRQPSQSMESFAGDMGEAAKLAQELSADLEKLSPRSDQAMSPQQRDRGRGLGERQGSLEQRARGLAEEMGRRASQIPGADKAGEEMKSIAGQMGDAGEDLQKGAPREGAGKAQEAAERLAKLRDAMGRRQMGQGQQRREPVRIPGADESKAPREWRQELLDAMREKAPDHFKEEVRKYYEELVK